jgi:hypothetical protein
VRFYELAAKGVSRYRHVRGMLGLRIRHQVLVIMPTQGIEMGAAATGITRLLLKRPLLK